MVASICTLCAIAGLATSIRAWGDDAAAGRDIAAKWEKSVVRVQLVLKSRVAAEGREMGTQESKIEATGTILDPSGLTLTSLSATDPGEAYRRFSGDEEGFDYKTEISDVKIRLADGKEIPARVVLRDKDLDMAFVRPVQKPTQPLPSVNLSDRCTLQLLDTVVVLARLGKVANRTIAVSMDRVQAIVEKPRKFYVLGLSGATDELGGAVFSLDGKLAGVILLRTVEADRDSYGSDSMVYMVVPASDIAEVAQQAPAEPPK